MGIFLKIFAMIMGFLMALFVKTPTTVYEPETVDINGVTYKNCFIPDYVCAYKIDDEGNTIYNHDNPFYVGRDGKKWFSGRDNMIMRDERKNYIADGLLLYCPEDEWGKLKSYYYDMNNWTFSMATRFLNAEGEPFFKENLSCINGELWNKMMENYSYDSPNYGKMEEVKLPYTPESNTPEIRFTMKSNNGFFGATSQDLLYYEGKYYFAYTYVGESYIIANTVPEDIQLFLDDIVGDYKLFNPF